MKTASAAIAAFVALQHTFFLVLEMFLWTTPFGLKTFKRSAEEMQATASLAKNQGLYNGFLAAGLIWGLMLGAGGTHIKLFFLGCVIVAGVYGAATVGRKILYVQALPAALAMAALLLA